MTEESTLAPFTIIPNAIIRCGTQLTHMEFRVLCNLLSWRQRGGEFWAYNGIIATSIGTTDTRRIRRVTSSLARKGALVKLPRKNPQSANTYQLVEDFFKAVTDTDTATLPSGHRDPYHEPQTPGQDGPPHTDAATLTPRTPRPVPSGQGDPEDKDKAAPQEKHLRKTRGEKPLEKQPSEQTLSPARFASEIGSASTTTLSGSDDDDTLRIPDGMHKERFIQLVRTWKSEIGAVNLSKEKLLASYKAMGIEEAKTKQTLNSAVVVAAAREQSLTFRSLFTASGSSYVWMELQKHATPAVSPASGGTADTGTASEPTDTPSASPKGQPSTETATPLAQIGAALQKQRAKKQPWPEDQVIAIYQAYPRKVGRGAALTAIQKALTVIRDSEEVDPVAFLVGRVQAYAKSRIGQEQKYTPHPATWMNELRFMDEIEDLTIDRTSRIVEQDTTNYVNIVNEMPEL